jgi:hypothetical protein
MKILTQFIFNLSLCKFFKLVIKKSDLHPKDLNCPVIRYSLQSSNQVIIRKVRN